MSFTKNVSITFVSRVLIIFLGLISGIIVARHLGPEGKGIFAVLGVIIGVATQFGNFGLHASNTYFIAKDKSKTPRILGNSLWVGLVVGTVISSIIYLLAKLYPQQILGGVSSVLVNITLASIPFLLLALFFQNILLGQQRIVLYNIIQIANQAVVVVGVIILFLFFKGNILSLVILSTAVGIATALVYWVYIVKDFKFDLRFDEKLFKESFKYGVKSYVASFLAYLILRSDIYLLNLLRGTGETGIYSLAAGFGDLIYILPAAIGTILFPKISSAPEKERVSITEKVSRHTVFIMLVVCIFVAIFAKPLIGIFYGKAFVPAFLPLLILLPGIFFWSVSNIYMNHFAGKGLPMIVIWSPLAALIVNIIMNLVLIPKFGMVAASISSSIAYGLVLGINLAYFKKEEKARLTSMLFIRKEEGIHLINLFKNKIRQFLSQ